ncbi:V-type proton ATPase subunit E [Hondaea fermentalgiana]|uniref:V-type proton ATPase subunit E n=1 Tax=Hondaea fermentalgiana TaxID=2315210 RepID=A0A2R5G2F1_9STRA|nr:V-type proton ATPase subunit E [Hondaea fermentalgiana]|eukprot:GBG25207.1 V-type proton ATPase subunit E [Hondaea fermentalgiana]
MESSGQRDAQIQQMCDFIIQEAKEKVNEIHLQTAHDSNLEKQMTVQKAKGKIMKEVKEKEKHVRESTNPVHYLQKYLEKYNLECLKIQQRIKVSRAEAQFRVKKMVAREELLDQVKASCIKALGSVTNDKAKYQSMLRDLIVQGLIKLNEPKVEVIVREADVDIANKAKDEASKKYSEIIKSETGQTAKVTLEVNPNGKCLPPASDGSNKKSCAGGVKLLASNGRIICDNTLDSRLTVGFDELMPEIRKNLFSTRV